MRGASMESVEPAKRVVADGASGTEIGGMPVRVPGVRAPGMREHPGVEARRPVSREVREHLATTDTEARGQAQCLAVS